MSKAWADFYDRVLPDLPGLPPGPPADDVIRRAAIDFCMRSRAWEVDHPAISVVAGTATYSLEPGDGMVAIEIKRATYGDEEITSATAAELDAWLPQWRAEQGDVTRYTQDDQESIRLVLTPASNLSSGLLLRVVVAPTEDAETIGDLIWSQHRQVIAHGAKAIAMMSPKKPYTNFELGPYHANEFNIGIGKEGVSQAKAYARRPLRTRTIHGID